MLQFRDGPLPYALTIAEESSTASSQANMLATATFGRACFA
jgi:hypothetical protein